MKNELSTDKSVQDILKNLEELTDRKKNKLSCSETIDYRKIRISGNKFIFEQNPSLINPFKAIGAITFFLSESEGKTKIIIEIDSYIKYTVIFLAIIFLFISFPLLILGYLNSFQSFLKIGLFWFCSWAIISGIIYQTYKKGQKSLENLSYWILKDMEIS